MLDRFTAEKMESIHSDIRGPLYYEALGLEKRGINVLKLNTGNPAAFGFEMPDSVYNALSGQLRRGLGYCDFRGMPEARAAICDYHKARGILDICEDDVIIGNGVSEVVSFALLPLLNPGDEVLVPAPCYSLWSNSVYLCESKPVYYVCDEKSNWFPDVKDIESKITNKTKAIVIINPNNPTGALYPNDILLKIADIARKNNLMIFSDEIYDRLVMDGQTHTSIAALAPDVPTVTMNGLSKSHCLCGFRCGWMVISGPKIKTETYRQGIYKLISMRLCSNALAQLVIPAAIADMETPLSMIRPGGRLYEQREATISELNKIDSISVIKNSAAFYVFPKLDVKKHNITDDRKFARDLLLATNILIVPGSGFDWKDPDHFRIVMLPKPEILRDAISRLGNFLDGYIQK